MKFFLLLGGFLGFVLAFTASWQAGNAPASALCDGAIGCLAGAVLLRMLHTVFFLIVRDHVVAEVARVRAETEASDDVSARA